ncbi:hypothetical protein ACVPOS_13545 [Staphylococcus aureus]
MKLGQKIDITSIHDRSFINCQANQIPTVVRRWLRAVNKGYTMADIQVLAPMYKGNAIKIFKSSFTRLF